MIYQRFGSTGLRVSELCLGTMTFLWTADEDASLGVLNAFHSAGGNFIDTADIYSRWAPGNSGGTAEIVIGKWLKLGSAPRDQVVLATKGRGPMGDHPNDQGASRAHLIAAVEASLRRLQTDYVDLYQIHWADMETTPEETLRALDALTAAGKIRYSGASNYPAWWLTKSLWVSDVRKLVRYESLQPHYNLMHRAEFERELMPLCIDQKLAVIPYSPLAGGFLTGKYKSDAPMPIGTRGEKNDRIQGYAASEKGQAVITLLESIGHTHGKSIAQTALAWQLSNPVITAPIVGANSAAQLQEALGAAEYRLTEGEMKQLNTASAWE